MLHPSTCCKNLIKCEEVAEGFHVITCGEFLACLPDFLNGELAPTLEPLVLQHVEQCPKCKIVLRSAERTLRAYLESEVSSFPSENKLLA
jgi:hypothetical protein